VPPLRFSAAEPELISPFSKGHQLVRFRTSTSSCSQRCISSAARTAHHFLVQTTLAGATRPNRSNQALGARFFSSLKRGASISELGVFEDG
jgi:hypothetical protein